MYSIRKRAIHELMVNRPKSYPITQNLRNLIRFFFLGLRLKFLAIDWIGMDNNVDFCAMNEAGRFMGFLALIFA